MATKPIFQSDPALLPDYPTSQTGVLFTTDLRSGPTLPAVQEQYQAEQAVVKGRLPASLSEVPSLAAWRTAFRRFGVNPTQYRCVAEALLRRLSKAGDIPSINALADICSFLSQFVVVLPHLKQYKEHNNGVFK